MHVIPWPGGTEIFYSHWPPGWPRLKGKNGERENHMLPAIKQILIAALAWAMISPQARAQAQVMIPCRIIDYDLTVERLTSTFGESRRHRGLIEGGETLLEVWRNDETGSWTTILIKPDGAACGLTAGSAWQNLPAQQEPSGDPA